MKIFFLEMVITAALLVVITGTQAEESAYAPIAAQIFEKAGLAEEKVLYQRDFEDTRAVEPMQLWYVSPASFKYTIVSQGVDRSVGFDGSKASYRVELFFEPEQKPEHYGGIYLRFPVNLPLWSDMKLQWRIKAESEPAISHGYRHGLSEGFLGGTDGNTTYGVRVKDADKDGWELWEATAFCGKQDPAAYFTGISLYIETTVKVPTKLVLHIDEVRITGRLQPGWQAEWKNAVEYYTVYAERENRAAAGRQLVNLRSWSESLGKRQAALQVPAAGSPMLLAQYKGSAAYAAAALAAARPLVEAVEAGLKSDQPFRASVHAAELKLMDARYWLDVAESCAAYAREQKDASVITYTLDPTHGYEVLPLGSMGHREQPYSDWNESSDMYENPQIFPDSRPVAARSGANLANFGARGLYVPFSFAVETGKRLENLVFTVGELSAGGVKLGAATDLRVVAPVYLPRGASFEPRLKNAMLVHDPDFVRVVGKEQGYNRFKNPVFPEDAAAMQPITIEAGQVRQFYLLVKVPAGARAGVYEGTVSGKAADGTALAFGLKLEVLPFDLEPTPIAYSAFCQSWLDAAPDVGRQRKTFAQIEQDFISQSEHGFNTLHLKNGYVPRSKGDPQDRTPLKEGESWNFEAFDRMLEAVVKAGLTRSPFVWESSHGAAMGIGSRKGIDPQTYEEMVAWIEGYVPALVAHCREKGYPAPALFGADEFTGERLMGMKPGYEAIKKAGGLVTVACYRDFFAILGPDLILPMLCGGVTDAGAESIFRAVQAKGQQVWIYNCPATNNYNAPAPYRRRYGLAMWRNGEDGVCNWAFDDLTFGKEGGYDNLARHNRPVFCYAFPTGRGPLVDTITYEALREGIYDTRYMATLEKALAAARNSGKAPGLVSEVDAWLKSFSVNEDLQKVRRKMADYTLKLTGALKLAVK